MKYAYASEKFAMARRILMLPPPGNESFVIMNAFHECSLGLHNLDESELDDNSRLWLSELKELMNTDGIVDDTGRGTWIIKAERLSTDEKRKLAMLVDDLTYWFDSRNN